VKIAGGGIGNIRSLHVFRGSSVAVAPVMSQCIKGTSQKASSELLSCLFELFVSPIYLLS
jgi:hypothetical protein